MIIVSKYLVPNGYIALTLYPFIFLKSKKYVFNTTLIHHERIHIRQQLELLIIPFYMVYGIEFLVRFISCKNWKKAYKNISFEKEAFANETNFEFLKQRSFWNFIKYF